MVELIRLLYFKDHLSREYHQQVQTKLVSARMGFKNDPTRSKLCLKRTEVAEVEELSETEFMHNCSLFGSFFSVQLRPHPLQAWI